jgi:hypothetical protein
MDTINVLFDLLSPAELHRHGAPPHANFTPRPEQLLPSVPTRIVLGAAPLAGASRRNRHLSAVHRQRLHWLGAAVRDAQAPPRHADGDGAMLQ